MIPTRSCLSSRYRTPTLFASRVPISRAGDCGALWFAASIVEGAAVPLYPVGVHVGRSPGSLPGFVKLQRSQALYDMPVVNWSVTAVDQVTAEKRARQLKEMFLNFGFRISGE